MAEAKFTPAGALLDGWEAGIFSGERPATFALGTGDMESIEFGPGRVLLIGGSPGAGKTALVMQWVFHALSSTPDLRAVVCNVEMGSQALLDRQLARTSRVNLRNIRRRELDPEQSQAVRSGLAELKPLCGRVAFVDAPYSLDNVTLAADAFDAGLIVLDYVQRIKPPGRATEKRMQLEATMDAVRQIAGMGVGVIVVAAVARSKDQKGRNSYDNLTLASFRESSELEYGADDAFILAGTATAHLVRLKHLKSRYGETADIELHFERPYQSFTTPGVSTPPAPQPASATTAGKVSDRLKAAFNSTKPAPEKKR